MRKEAAIVVFGCRHEKEYMARINQAFIWLTKNDINPIFIFTGADPIPVIPIVGKSQVILEDKSTTTEENIDNILKMMPRPVFGIPNGLNVIIVSSWYHISRIKLFLKRRGIRLPKENFIKSYKSVKLINILVEPFALLAAFFRINHWPAIIRIKHLLGYNV